MAAKLKDIAEKLGLSISTVSYALNGGPRPVTDEVKRRVVETARAMGYRPNRIARSLAAGRTMTLGVLPAVVTKGLTVIPYFQSCFNGIVNELEVLEYDALLYTHTSPTDADQQADVLLDGRVDGLIFLAPPPDSPVLNRVKNAGVPFAVIYGEFEESIPCYVADNDQGIGFAVQHLEGLGHRKIAHIHGDPLSRDGAERLEAFKRSMSECGLAVESKWLINGEFSPAGGYEAALRLLKSPNRPTAIVCGNDENAVGVYRAAAELGLRIPQDLSVTGFDDAISAQILIPQLTTVRQPMEEMGAAAARAVVGLLNGLDVVGKKFDTELVVRRSTAEPL